MTVRKDIIGERRGRLLILETAYRNGRDIYMRCQCDCGNVCYVSRRQLLKKIGGTESCGCIRVEKSKERIHQVQPYRYNRQNANKAKAIAEFEEAINDLASEYHIPDSVIKSYCTKFRTKLGYV